MSRNNHNGNTSRIRALLERSEPLRADQIGGILGLSASQVRDALNIMVSRLGGAAFCGRDGVYRLYTAPSKVSAANRPQRTARGSGVIAPPPYRTGFRWGLSLGRGG